jgi:hypothetical protein
MQGHFEGFQPATDILTFPVSVLTPTPLCKTTITSSYAK